jgi:O-antigen/teichoic acid export membrane protein
VVGPLVSITFAVVSVSLAAAGWGVWAMVAGQYASQAAALLALWLLVGWRPRRGRASAKLWRELARYGFPLVLATLVARGRTLAEAFVVGRWLSPSSLGLFRYAQPPSGSDATTLSERFVCALVRPGRCRLRCFRHARPRCGI